MSMHSYSDDNEANILSRTDNFPIRYIGHIHNGKVRSVYWLSHEDSKRIIDEYNYEDIHPESNLGVMIISDRISAFNVNWAGENGYGVSGKGASLNAISEYWLGKISEQGIAEHHILDTPHPLVWIVKKAQPIKIEAIARQYITGSMWRAYERGERTFCGISLPEGLEKNQRLDELLITPTTKGVVRELVGVPAKDDTPITRKQIENNYFRLNFYSPEDIDHYETIVRDAFGLMNKELLDKEQILADTKFEFGYVRKEDGIEMICIDEVGTPDSSRMWDKEKYERGIIEERSKEYFRKFLLNKFGKDVTRTKVAKKLAKNYKVPSDVFAEVSEIYRKMAKDITGKNIPNIKNARQEVIDSLKPYGIIKNFQ